MSKHDDDRDNMWPMVIGLIFLTPLGWIGLICAGLAVSLIIHGPGQ